MVKILQSFITTTKLMRRIILDNILYIGFIFVSFLSGILMTSLFFVNKIFNWRIKCVGLEYDLARLENRTPRDIDDI